MRDEVSRLGRENDALATTLKKQKEEIAEKDQEMRKLKWAAKTSRDDKSSRAPSRAGAGQDGDLGERLANLKDENSELKDENGELKERIKNLMKSVDQPNVDQALEESKMAVIDDSSNVDDMKEHIWNLEQKIEIMEEEGQVMMEQQRQEKEDVSELEAQLADMWDKYNTVLAKGSKKGTKQDAMKNEIEDLTNENARLRYELKETEKKAKPTKRLEVKLDKKDREYEKLLMKYEKLESQHEMCGLEQAVATIPSDKKGKGKKGQGGGDKELEKLKSMIE